MKYNDFVLRFGSEHNGGFTIDVLSSPAGVGRGTFRPPLGFDQVTSALPGLWREIEIVAHEVPEPRSLQHVGTKLYNALFSGIIGQLFEASFGLGHEQGSGLRIKIEIDPEQQEVGHIQALPWEALYNPKTRSFLALSRLTPVIRYWRIGRRLPMPPRDSVFRVLLVAPEPLGFAPLEIADEFRRIAAAFETVRDVEIVTLNRATLISLRTALLDKPIHALHFAGMAGFAGEQGALLFEDDGREPAKVTGESLAYILRDVASLRLIVLNACDTGRIAGSGWLNPFRGVAATLVHAGFPAVVGMQFPISDRAAIEFSAAFYRRLAAGDPIEGALTEARQAIYMADATSFEWSTPVLFSRMSDGFLFGTPEDALSKRLKVFMCHSSPDKPKVRELYRQLIAEGFNVWLDEINILPGKLWKAEIYRAMRESHVILICLSRNAVSKAGYVQTEIKVALELLAEQPEGALFIIPLRLDECEVPVSLRDIQFADLSTDGGYSRLITSLRQKAREVGAC